MAKHVADDISWTEAKGFPYAGIYIELEDITKIFFSRLGSEWIDYKSTTEDYVTSDDKVLAYETYTGTYKITGKSFTARVAHIWKLKRQQNHKVILFF